MTKGGKKIIGNRLPDWLIDDDNNNVRATSIIVFLLVVCMSLTKDTSTRGCVRLIGSSHQCLGNYEKFPALSPGTD